MSKAILRVFAISGLILASALSALSEPNYMLRVHVPFEFIVGQATLPAGDYVIEQDGLSGVVTLQNRDGKRSAAVISVNGSLPVNEKEPRLLFRRINGHNVLSQIQLTDQPSRTMPTSFAPVALH
jgi:hypothetical protein